MDQKQPTLPELRDHCIAWLLANRHTINLIGISAEISETGKPIQNFQQMVLGKRRFKERYIIPLYAYLTNFMGLKPIVDLEPAQEEKPAPVIEAPSKEQEIWGKRLIIEQVEKAIFITGHGLEFIQNGRDYDIKLDLRPAPFNLELINKSEKLARAARELILKINE